MVDDGVIQQRRDQTKLCSCIEIVRLLLDSLGILPASIPQEQVSSTKCCLIFFKRMTIKVRGVKGSVGSKSVC